MEKKRERERERGGGGEERKKERTGMAESQGRRKCFAVSVNGHEL